MRAGLCHAPELTFVVTIHRDHQVVVVEPLAPKLSCFMFGCVASVLQRSAGSSISGVTDVPAPGSGATHLHMVKAFTLELGPEHGRRHGRPTDVPHADEDHVDRGLVCRQAVGCE